MENDELMYAVDQNGNEVAMDSPDAAFRIQRGTERDEGTQALLKNLKAAAKPEPEPAPAKADDVKTVKRPGA